LKKSFLFTQKRIEDLPLPVKGREEYQDQKVSGLWLRVTSKGKKVFFAKRWFKKEQQNKYVTLARFQELSIDQVRNKARKVLNEIADGIDPNASQVSIDHTLTFEDAFERYMQDYALIHKKTWKDDQSMFNVHLQGLKRKRLESITRNMIIHLHAEIGKKDSPKSGLKQTRVANKVLVLVSSVFNKAKEWGLFEGENPAHQIKKFRSHSRERFLNAVELRRMFEAIEQVEELAILTSNWGRVSGCLFLRLAVMTGARRSNVLAMEWENINWKEKTWFIPGIQAKNEVSQRLPLSDWVIQELRKQHERQPELISEYGINAKRFVLPGRGKTGHLADPKRVWEEVKEKSKLHGVRIHDLRRTLGSWEAATGANLSVIGKTLNHKSVQSTAIYARLDLDPVRAAVETAHSEMIRAIKPDGLVIRTEGVVKEVVAD